jgi:hypothetical protein
MEFPLVSDLFFYPYHKNEFEELCRMSDLQIDIQDGTYGELGFCG